MDKDLWMNANKLADDLDNANGFQYIAQLGLASQAATMLRQQQAEIESLKLQLHTTLTNRKLRTYDGKQSYYEAMDTLVGLKLVKSVTKVNHEFNSSPIKELTDEEIIQIYADIDGKGIVEFARTILRKAQKNNAI